MNFFFRPMLRLGAAAFFLLLACSAHAEWLSVRDDEGQIVRLPAPAHRVVSLAPHATELLFAAGGGAALVGVVSHSDYPEAAQHIPRIGDLQRLDIERILAAKPDLLVVWMHSAFSQQLEPLRKAGVPLFFSDPRTLRSVPDTLRRLGVLLGTTAEAQAQAARLEAQLSALEKRYAGQPRLSVFFQVWNKPLYTLNGSHIINDVLRLCGAKNVFAHLAQPAPVVSVEAVLAADPDVILSAASSAQGEEPLALWQGLSQMRAVRQHHLLTVDADLLNRPGPRIFDGAARVCSALERARSAAPAAAH